MGTGFCLQVCPVTLYLSNENVFIATAGFHPLPLLYSVNRTIGVPRDLLLQLLAADHPSRPGRRGIEKHRCPFGVADTGPHAFLPVHVLEQLNHDEGDFQQETRSGMTTAVSFVFCVGGPATYTAECYSPYAYDTKQQRFSRGSNFYLWPIE